MREREICPQAKTCSFSATVVRLVHLKTLSSGRQRGQSFIPRSTIYLCCLSEMTSAKIFTFSLFSPSFSALSVLFVRKFGHPSPSVRHLWRVPQSVSHEGRERGMVALFGHGFPSRKLFFCCGKFVAWMILLCIYAHNPCIARSPARPFRRAAFLRPFAVSLTFIRSSHRGGIGLASRRRNELEAEMSPFPHFSQSRERAETHAESSGIECPPARGRHVRGMDKYVRLYTCSCLRLFSPCHLMTPRSVL